MILASTTGPDGSYMTWEQDGGMIQACDLFNDSSAELDPVLCK